MSRRGIVATAALLVGCGERAHPAPPAPSTTIVAAPTISAPSAAPPPATAAPAPPASPEERQLAEAPLASLTPVRRPLIRRGTFEAMLGPPAGRAVTLELALGADPVGYRRPLAFARLARALGARVVPAAVLRHVPAGELGAVVEGSAEARALVGEARVLNDGTVDALLVDVAPAAPGTVAVDTEHAREMATWEVWARSPEPAQGERAGLLRDYVEMLVLDYLAGNVVRRQALLRGGEGLVLADNASTFTPHADPAVLDRMLRRLRGVERFPRGLRDALAGFDRDRAAAVFAEGGFETWLLAPRVRVELDERRAALLTLVEAKIAARGADAVLRL